MSLMIRKDEKFLLPLESVSCAIRGPYADGFGMMQIMPHDGGWVRRTLGRLLGLKATALLQKLVRCRTPLDRLAEFSLETFVKMCRNPRNSTLSAATRELAARSQKLPIGGH